VIATSNLKYARGEVGPDIAAVELLDDAVVGEAVGFLQI